VEDEKRILAEQHKLENVPMQTTSSTSMETSAVQLTPSRKISTLPPLADEEEEETWNKFVHDVRQEGEKAVQEDIQAILEHDIREAQGTPQQARQLVDLLHNRLDNGGGSIAWKGCMIDMYPIHQRFLLNS
jgi:hypothetical protein